jgi:hypothetical protein
MTTQHKLLSIIGIVVLLSGCEVQNTASVVSPELKALREQHGGATNWLECQQGIVVDVYTRSIDHNFMPRSEPLEQHGNYVRCDADSATVQAIEVSKDE